MPTSKKVALVTGGSRGIGFGVAKELARSGFDIVINGRREADSVVDAVSTLRSLGADVLYCRADVASTDDKARMLKEIDAHFGRLDVLVNNAGVAPEVRADITEASEQSFDRLININLKGPYFLTQAVANWMIKTKGTVPNFRGVIINVSSVAGWLPGSTYAAAKGWVRLFTEGLALELSGTDVSAMALCPGYTRTEFHDRAGMDMRALPSFAWMDADQVVAAALRDARRGRVVSVPGTLNRTGRVVLALLPASAKRRIALRRPGSAR